MQVYSGKANICRMPTVKSEHTDSTIPHKIFQYMYAGKPFVASDCLPIRRIAEETDSGLIHRWDDPEAWAACIAHLSNDEALFRRLARNGTRAVIEKYNWNRDAEILASVYA